jgi:hypothetical protein
MRGAIPTLPRNVFLARRKDTFTLTCGHALCFRLHYKFPYFVSYYWRWLAAGGGGWLGNFDLFLLQLLPPVRSIISLQSQWFEVPLPLRAAGVRRTIQMRTEVLWDVMPCRLVNICRRFEVT